MAEAAYESTHIHHFADKINIENADRLVAEIYPFFDLPQIQRVVFNLENVNECSSYGLRLFFIFQRRADECGKTLVLYRPTPVLMGLFRTTHLDHVFTIVQTLE